MLPTSFFADWLPLLLLSGSVNTRRCGSSGDTGDIHNGRCGNVDTWSTGGSGDVDIGSCCDVDTGSTCGSGDGDTVSCDVDTETGDTDIGSCNIHAGSCGVSGLAGGSGLLAPCHWRLGTLDFKLSCWWPSWLFAHLQQGD